MTIKNTSSKIISIGKTALLPDDTMEISEAIANTPAIKAMVGRRQLSINGNRKDKPAKGDKDTTATQEGHQEEHEAHDDTHDETGDETNGESGGETTGGSNEDKKPLSRMNKSELIAECQRLGIEVGPDDTNPMMVEKIRAATAE